MDLCVSLFRVLAIFLGSPGFPFYSSIKGLMLASPVPYYGPRFHYFLANWLFLFCLSISGPTSAFRVHGGDTGIGFCSVLCLFSCLSTKMAPRSPLRHHVAGLSLLPLCSGVTCFFLFTFWLCFSLCTFPLFPFASSRSVVYSPSRFCNPIAVGMSQVQTYPISSSDCCELRHGVSTHLQEEAS